MFQIERTSFDTLLVNKALIFFLLLLRGCRLHIAGELFQSHKGLDDILKILLHCFERGQASRVKYLARQRGATIDLSLEEAHVYPVKQLFDSSRDVRGLL